MDSSVQDSSSTYYLDIVFSRNAGNEKRDPIILQRSSIKEFSITLDLNRLLPSVKLMVDDPSGLLTHLTPFDHDFSKMSVRLGGYAKKDSYKTTDFNFDIYRRKPTDADVYTAEGLLQCKKLFSPNQIRGFSGKIKNSISDIAEEIGATSSQVSVSLNYDKMFIQPNCTNGELLNWLKENVIGSSGEAGYFCTVICDELDTVLIFKNVIDFCKQNPKHHFSLSPSPYKDGEIIYYPISEYIIVDNYKLLGISGAKKQNLLYYDYYNSEFFVSSLDTDEVFSLTDHFMIDSDDEGDENISIDEIGSSNEFTKDFLGLAKNIYHKRLFGLSKMWITTWGLEDLFPGDVVYVDKLNPTAPGLEMNYQYQGYWLVERVVHLIGNGFFTRLLLTRNGYDIGEGVSTLLKSLKRKL